MWSTHYSLVKVCAEGSSRRLKKPQFALPQHAVQLRSRRRGPGSTRVVALRQPSPKNSPRNSVDTTLAWGDAITLAATELASERIPFSQLGFLCSIMVVSWVGVSAQEKPCGMKMIPSLMIPSLIVSSLPLRDNQPVVRDPQVAVVKGDYRITTKKIGYGQLQSQMILAVINAAATWVGSLLMNEFRCLGG